MKKIKIYNFIFLLLIFTLNKTFASNLIDINNEELIILEKKGVPIIDIRTRNEWLDTGIIPNSHTHTFIYDLERDNFDKWVKEISKNIKLSEPFIIICRSGKRSKALSQLISSKQITSKFYNSKKGIIGWLRSGGRVKKYE